MLPVFAQVPQKMNYQAVARNSSGTPITNHLIGIKFTIHETSASGPDIFAETMSATTNSMGTFSVEIGGGTAVLGSFATIPWNTGAKYLNIKIDPNGGTTYTDMGTFQLLSVAYAQFAKNVLNNDDADASPTNELQNLSIAGNQLSISSGNTVTIPAGSDNWGTQVVITDATLSGNGLSGSPLKIAQQGATNGQVLKWNGTTWIPGTDNTGGGGTTPGGTDGNIQFNSAGSFGGDANLGWNNTSKKLFVGSSASSATSRLCIGGTGYYGASLGLKNVNEYSLTSGDDGAFRMVKITGSTFVPLLITSLGKVGIDLPGDEPQGKMEIYANSSSTFPHLMLTESEGDYSRLAFNNTANPTKSWHIAGYADATDANSRLNMWYYNGTTGSDILSISGSGKVGINTTSPEHQFNIHGGSANTYMTFKNDNTGNDPFNGLLIGSAISGASYIWQYENMPLYFSTNNANRMSIMGDGKVGIGTTGPAALLDIVGGGAGLAFPSLHIYNSNVSGIAAYITNNSGDATMVVSNGIGASGTTLATMAKFFDGGAGDLIHFDNLNGSHAGCITLLGNNTGTQSGGMVYGLNAYGLVGASKLNGVHTVITETRVNESAQKVFEPFNTNDTKLGSSTYKWTEVWATNGVIQTSDERDKVNISALNSGLNAVMQLKPVSFQWKNEKSRLGTGTSLGFIAQDLEKVLPDAVVHVVTPQEAINNAKAAGKEDLPEDVYGVKYAEIVPVLVKAIQDQQQIINELQERVRKLENQ